MIISTRLFMFAAPLSLTMLASLPIFTDFNADTPGSPPALGGPDQPTSLNVPGGGSVLVQTSAAGLNTQPVALYDDNGEYVSVNWTFPSVANDVVRFEATVSMDQVVSGYFLQTTNAGSAVLARLQLNTSGQITASATVVGNYQPNTPVRIRIDNDIVAYSYAVTVDEEMDGFADNTTHSGLAFTNSGLTEIGGALASLNEYGAGVGATIAYDDISIGLLQQAPGVAYCFGDGSGTSCPCGNNNNGSAGGCDWGDAAFPEGGILDAVGSTSMAANDTHLTAVGIADNFGIFFGADNQVNGGNGNPLNDGLRCAGGGLVRLIPPTMASGNQATTPSPIQTLDTGAAAGVTRRYQYWFRTPAGPCGQQANLTNGYEIVWAM